MFDVYLQCDSKKDSTCKRDVRDGREMVASRSAISPHKCRLAT